MGGISVGRWIAGGLAASLVVWLLEGVAGILYMNDVQEALQRLGLAYDMASGARWASTAVSVITGFALVFFYAAARPRLGPGPKNALIVAVGLWLSGYVLSLAGYYMLGLYPIPLLVKWAVAGLIEMIIAAMVGGWVYRESPPV